MYCSTCGRECAQNFSFCPHCGASLPNGDARYQGSSPDGSIRSCIEAPFNLGTSQDEERAGAREEVQTGIKETWQRSSGSPGAGVEGEEWPSVPTVQSRHWFRLAPQYIEFMKEQIVHDKAFFFSQLVSEVDAVGLLEKGVVGVHWDNTLPGFVVWPHVWAMVAHSEFDTLRHMFTQLTSQAIDDYPHAHYLNLFCRDVDRGTVKRELFKAHMEHSDLCPMLLLHTGLNGAEKSLQWLEGWGDALMQLLPQLEEKVYEISQICDLAKVWMILHENKQKAGQFLDEAMAVSSTCYHWLACAGGAATLEDDEQVLWCLLQAKRAAAYTHNAKGVVARTGYESVNEWVECASDWWRLLGDAREARECLLRAEEIAQSATRRGEFEWGAVARGWKNLFADDEAVRRCLQEWKQRGKKGYPQAWVECARTWRWFDRNAAEARHSLEMAGKLVEGSSEWSFVAETWLKDFSEERQARGCARKAEKLARHAGDWTSCAEIWARVLENSKRARRCMKKAGKSARACRDYISCAITWDSVLGDRDEAVACMRRAESAAETEGDPHAWAHCAMIWESMLENTGAARYCTSKAEALGHKGGE